MRQLIPLMLLASLVLTACSAAGPTAGTDQAATAVTVYESPT